MSSRNKLVKAIQNLFRQMMQLARVITKTLMNWLLRSLMVIGRSSKLAKSGFILPTVTMVILVVILLTTAMVFRSFDRSKNASNVRVSQATLAAATPALDRAKAKISALLNDPTLPRSTPTDVALNQAIAGSLNKYTLGDETQLLVQYDINGNNTIEKATNLPLDNNESTTTAWRFPVDTDNNGKFDSYTLYGIYFRTPNPSVRPKRTPIEARTAPMDDSAANPACAAAQGSFAGLVGGTGWYKTGSLLKKSFYVFAATVPYTGATQGNMETYTGNRGFSAIEYQQDRAQIPLNNNAVVYEDDLEITPGSGLKVNGRIQTNSNLITSRAGSGDVEYYQVSSLKSCFYQEENGKITVGGNLLVGNTTGASVSAVKVDRYQPNTAPRDDLTTTNNTVSNPPNQAAYNSQAYANRINILVQKWTSANPNPTPDITSNDPDDVKDLIPGGASLAKQQEIRLSALEDYFRDRMRRVPYAEDTTGDAAKTYLGTKNTLRPPDEWVYPVNPTTGASNNSLTLVTNQPPATEPTEQQKGKVGEKYLGDRILVGNGLPAKWWDSTANNFQGEKGQQLVKPNADWNYYLDSSKKARYRTTQVFPLSDLGNTDRDGFWEQKAAEAPDQPLAAVGGVRVVTGAGVYTGFHVGPNIPITAANASASFLPAPASVPDAPSTNTVNESQFIPVWPDSMPMWEDTQREGIPDLPIPSGDRRGDLVMRATAVYHYKSSSANSLTQRQTPIACVSSYYDPSTSVTARNQSTLAASFAGPPGVTGTIRGRSNNGISYDAAPVAAALPTTSASPNGTTGLFPYTAGVLGAGAENPANSSVSILDRLYYQANLIFPNGRFVNEPLRDALTSLAANGVAALTLAQQSTFDSTICALKIADETLSRNATVIPDGSIYETSFLDAREIKAIDRDNDSTDDATGGLATFRAINTTNGSTLTGNYDLGIEERQPLEIRVTALDLNKLRQTTIGTAATNTPSTEYLLPDSGIIYATREDALLDLSEPLPTAGTEAQKVAARKSKSPVDFKLDPTRRPSGIMLVNGSTLARGAATPTNSYTLVNPPGAEKGLILATNLPAYVKADVKGFNLHQTSGGARLEEFQEQLATDPTYTKNVFYNRATPEYNFACRNGQPGLSCSGGDLWRPATVLADSVTLLSDSFRFGFRNEGDYDLRNNQGDPVSITERKNRGFWNNNFVTNGLSSGISVNVGGIKTPTDADYTSNTPSTNYVASSYFNNFVTPIQRRGQFSEYVMEICRKLPVSQCGPTDWVIGIPGNLNLGAKDASLIGKNVSQLFSGTTATPAPGYDANVDGTVSPEEKTAEQRYPRRVAFQRDASNNLVLIAGKPVPLGINNTGTVQAYPYSSSTLPRTQPNALLYRTTSNTTNPSTFAAGDWSYSATKPLFYRTQDTVPFTANDPALTASAHPLLVPVLQFHLPNQAAGANPDTASPAYIKNNTLWLHRPSTDTTFNLVVAGGDSPINGLKSESNGGLQNFVRFIENWYQVPARISGSFIQFKHSSQSTAPFQGAQSATPPSSPFGYTKLYSSEINTIGSSGGGTAFYVEPFRYWGFDVALLSQLPDRFSQQFVRESPGAPNEFYREVGRDDEWVKTLLCAKELANGTTAAIDSDQRPPGTFCTAKTGG